MRIEPFQMGSFASMGYLIGADGGSEVVVIDPGEGPERMLAFLSDESLSVVAILDTHGHGDHIAGNGELKDAFPDAPLLIGEADAHMLTDPAMNLSGMFGSPWISPPADRKLTGGEKLEYAGLIIEVRHVPGHSPGHMVFHIAEAGACFCGDTVFTGSIGRSDFPGGDGPTLIAAIGEQILTLPPETKLYPGHGPPTTVARETAANPFLRA